MNATSSSSTAPGPERQRAGRRSHRCAGHTLARYSGGRPAPGSAHPHWKVVGVVEEGITLATHLPHRLCRAGAGRSRSQPVRESRESCSSRQFRVVAGCSRLPRTNVARGRRRRLKAGKPRRTWLGLHEVQTTPRRSRNAPGAACDDGLRRASRGRAVRARVGRR